MFVLLWCPGSFFNGRSVSLCAIGTQYDLPLFLTDPLLNACDKRALLKTWCGTRKTFSTVESALSASDLTFDADVDILDFIYTCALGEYGPIQESKSLRLRSKSAQVFVPTKALDGELLSPFLKRFESVKHDFKHFMELPSFA
jgi:hypothetical protein